MPRVKRWKQKPSDKDLRAAGWRYVSPKITASGRLTYEYDVDVQMAWRDLEQRGKKT